VQRICFRRLVNPAVVPENRSARVWPEKRAALHDAGWSNHSIFVEDDAQTVSRFEGLGGATGRTPSRPAAPDRLQQGKQVRP